MIDNKEELKFEKLELDNKIGKLSVFIDGRIFPTIPRLQQKLLIAQKGFMGSYSRILGERIQQLNA